MSTVASEDRINGTASDSRSVVADLWSMDDMLSRLASRYSAHYLLHHPLSRYVLAQLVCDCSEPPGTVVLCSACGP